MFKDKLFTKKLRSVSYILVADDDLDDQEPSEMPLLKTMSMKIKFNLLMTACNYLSRSIQNKILPSLI